MSELSPDLFRKKVTRLQIAIALLAVLLIASVYLLYRKESLLYAVAHEPTFVDPVSFDSASMMVSNYRTIPSFPVTTKRSYGVFYTKEEIAHYLDYTYPDIIAKYTLPDNCKWVVGFYFMKKIDKQTHKRQDFFVIPSAYDTVKHAIIDCFDQKAMYKVKGSNKPLTDPPPPAYDAGHLWP